MTNDQGERGSGVGSSRRTFLRATATTGAVLGIGGMTYAQDQQFSEIRLGGVVAGWRGRAPSFIEGEMNPALPLQAGQEYTIIWENVDGEPHNVAIFNQAGSVVVRSEIISGQGATQEVTFTAEPGMTTYVCQVHPRRMRGEVSIEGGGAAGNETVMPANGTMNATTNETAPTNATMANVTVNESAWGEDPLLYVAEFANGTQAAGNVTGFGTNETAPAANGTAELGGNGTTTAGDGTVEADNETAAQAQHQPNGNETGGTGNETVGIGNETVGIGNETVGTGNETDDEAAAEQHQPNGNETAGAGNETAGTGTETAPAGNETDDEAAEEQHQPNGEGDNETVAVAENETVMADDGTAGNGTAGNGTADGEQPAVGPADQTSAVRFTLHPPNGVQPKLLYNVSVWGVEDVTGAELVVVGDDGEDQVVASLLAPDDPIDYPQGMIAHGTILAADLLGPLAGESLRALVQEIDERDAYVVVRTRDMGVLRAPVRSAEDDQGDDQDQQTEGSD